MALTLLNSYVAVKDPEGAQGVVKGTVVMVAAGVTGIVANDRVYFPPGDRLTVKVNGIEYLLLQASEIIAKA